MEPKYKHLIKEPSREILNKNIENTSTFSKILQDLNDPNSLISSRNNKYKLWESNLASHPSIHRGYCDELKDGVLLVKEEGTDKLIRKDESILTLDGFFLHIDNLRIIRSISQLDLEKTKKDLITNSDKLKDLVFYHPFVEGYCSFKKEHLKQVISSLNYSKIIYNLYRGFIANTWDSTLVPERVEDFHREEFLAYLEIYLPARLSEATSLHLFSSKETINNVKVSENIYLSDARPRPYKPGIFLNADTYGLKWDVDRIVGNYNLVETDLWFNFILSTRQASLLKKSKKTRNNEGMLLSYSNRVENYKVPFLMLPEEQRLYDFYAGKKRHPDQNPIYLGVEIEVVARAAYANSTSYGRLLKDIADSKFGDHMIMKSDSSMHSPYGIEMVTIPASLAYHKKMFEENFFSKENAFHKKVMSTENCGIHVHISKNVLTELKWGQLINFINALENSSFIDAMSNRTQNSYCVRQPVAGKNKHGVNLSAKIVAKACNQGMVRGKLDTNTRSHRDSTRRVSVNWDNGATIELRCFKSSNDKNNILRKLEFCDSLVHFVRNHSTQQMTVYDYINFILESSTKKEYPYIVRWLASKNYIDHTRKKIQGLNKLVNIYGTNKVPIPDTIFHKQKEIKNVRNYT